jgi:hypothetical protein
MLFEYNVSRGTSAQSAQPAKYLYVVLYRYTLPPAQSAQLALHSNQHRLPIKNHSYLHSLSSLDRISNKNHSHLQRLHRQHRILNENHSQ